LSASFSGLSLVVNIDIISMIMHFMYTLTVVDIEFGV